MPRKVPPAVDVPTPRAPLRVVGDVHLEEGEPEVVEAFCAWLEGQRGRGGTLVLLGDVFEVWVGRPMQHDPLPARVLGLLQSLVEAGTDLKFMVGNRDVAFRGADGLDAEIWPDPVRTRLGTRTVLFTHGDQLCTADHGYLAMRRFFHGPGGKALERMPYGVKRWLADGIRGLSRRETGRKRPETMGLDYGEALAWLERHEADVLVAGHVHTGVHHVHPGPPRREVLVLKDWQAGGSVITWDGEALALEAVRSHAGTPGI